MSFHPHLDAAFDSADTEDPATLAIFAAGRDISHQLGRIADHLTIESVVNEAASFGRYPAGHPADRWPDAPADPNIATRDEAAVALAAAQPAR